MIQFFKKIEETPSTPALLKKLKALEEGLAKTRKELQETKDQLRLSLGRVAVVRFNPFKDVGGNQSFSVALLNDHHDGVVLTSHFGRETNRVYAKQIKKGKPEFPLSQEEEEALDQAMKSEARNPKQ